MKMILRAMVITLVLAASTIMTSGVAHADGNDSVDVVDFYYTAGVEAMKKGYLDVAESRFLASARYALSDLSRADYQAGDLDRSLKALGNLYSIQGKDKAALMVNQMIATQR